VSIIFFSKKGRHYRSFLPREEQDKPGHGQTCNLIDLLYSIQYNSFISIFIVIETSQDVTIIRRKQIHITKFTVTTSSIACLVVRNVLNKLRMEWNLQQIKHRF
jgi:hypothetical protein